VVRLDPQGVPQAPISGGMTNAIPLAMTMNEESQHLASGITRDSSPSCVLYPQCPVSVTAMLIALTNCSAPVPVIRAVAVAARKRTMLPAPTATHAVERLWRSLKSSQSGLHLDTARCPTWVAMGVCTGSGYL
jgi:hypothetical protein